MTTPITHNEYLVVEQFANDLKDGIRKTIDGTTILDQHSRRVLRFVDNMLELYRKRFELFDKEFARVMDGK